MIGKLGDLGMGEKMLRPARNFLMVPLALNQLCLFFLLGLQEIVAEMFPLLGSEHTQDLFQLKTQPKPFLIRWLENLN